MSPRIVSNYEMHRRGLMIDAKSDLTNAMSGHMLTPLEWLNVLHEMQARILAIGLREEWFEDNAAD